MNKKGVVLITGGTGFLGSRIVAMLLDGGYRVIVLKRKASKLDKLAAIASNSRLSFFDYEMGLEKCFKQNKIDFIIHTATCYGRPSDSYADVVKANLILPLELLELSLQHRVKLFANADTFSHGKLGVPPKLKSYITTKKLFLETAKDMVDKTSLKFASVCVEQMYGPYDNDAKFVITVLKSLLRNESEFKLSPGEQKRDFVYVDDVARAFVHVLEYSEKLGGWEEFDAGSGKTMSIRKAVMIMKKLCKADTILKWGALPYRKNEIMDAKACIKNNMKIHWKPVVSFEKGIALAIKQIKKDMKV